MRTVLIILLGLLVGCNSDDDSAYATTAQVKTVSANSSVNAAQMQAFQQQLNTLSAQVKQIQLIGRPNGTAAKTDSVTTMRMLTEPTLAPAAVTATGTFGTCPNMGVQDGFTPSSSDPDALSAIAKAFKTCTGYHVEYNTTDGSVKFSGRIFWDGPNCTGNLLEWEAGGAGYDTETLQDGVVFGNPTNGSIMMVASHQTPQPILIQSVFVLSNPGCQSDVETQLMYVVSANSTQTTGVPNTAIGKFTTGAP